MLPEALFTTANRWTQPRSPSLEMDKHSVVRPCSGILLNLRMECSTETSHIGVITQTGGRGHKDQALCDSDHMKCPGQMNLHRQIMVA